MILEQEKMQKLKMLRMRMSYANLSRRTSDTLFDIPPSKTSTMVLASLLIVGVMSRKRRTGLGAARCRLGEKSRTSQRARIARLSRGDVIEQVTCDIRLVHC